MRLTFNMHQMNAYLGSLIGRYPWHFFSISLIGSLIITLGVKDLRMEQDLRKSFSPRDSKSRHETDIYRHFFNFDSMFERFTVLISAKDGGTMLRPHVIAQVLQLDDFILKTCEEYSISLNRSMPIEKDGNCARRKGNEAFHAFQKALKIQQHRLDRNESLSQEIELGFPNSILYGHKVFTGAHLFSVQTVEQQEQLSLKMPTTMSFVESITLWYFYESEDTVEQKEAIADLELLIFDISQNNSYFESVFFNVYADAVGNQEMVRGAYEASRMFIIGFILMFIFVLAVMLIEPIKKGKMDPAILAIVATTVCSPLLAAGMAFGILAWCRIDIYSILCVTPFLVLGIGVDDAFIMMHSWQRHKRAACNEGDAQSVHQLMAAVFVDVIPSITITSVTNMFAFGVGALTPTPQMSTFCLCTALAVTFDLILEITLFAPVLALYGRREKQQIVGQTSTTSLAHKKKVVEEVDEPSSFMLGYSKFVGSYKARVVAVILLAFLYAISFVGIAVMRATFEPYKTFPADSPLAISLPRAKVIFDEFSPLSIIVNRPPNEMEYRRFFKMVDELEKFPTAYGADRTQLWLRGYEKFDQNAFQVSVDWGEAKSDEYRFSYNNLPNYIQSLQGAFQNDVKYKVDDKGQVTVQNFSFIIIGRDLSEWCIRAVFLQDVRGVLARYPEFQATPYDMDASLLDLLLSVKSNLITSVIVTLICMTAVCLVFISNKIGVIIVTMAIASICFTLLGLLSWAGADMDPVTMVDMLMAAGFSVDYTAHTVYHYCKKGSAQQKGSVVIAQQSPTARIAATLQAVAWPMIQAGLSTAICMVPLIFITTYAVVTFAKTVFIVVAVGFFHGLFILPVALAALPYSLAGEQDRCCKLRPKSAAKQYFLDEKLMVTALTDNKQSSCTENLL